MVNPLLGPEDNPPKPMVPHYYGDIERRIFLLAAVLMLLGLFFFFESIQAPVHVSLLVIVLLVLFAGFLNPRQRWLAILNVVISVTGLVVFGYESFLTRAWANLDGIPTMLSWLNLILAVTFLFALYFATKTLRWRFAKGKVRLADKDLL